MQMLVSYACSYNLLPPPHSLCPDHPPTQCCSSCYISRTHCMLYASHALLILILQCTLHTAHIWHIRSETILPHNADAATYLVHNSDSVLYIILHCTHSCCISRALHTCTCTLHASRTLFILNTATFTSWMISHLPAYLQSTSSLTMHKNISKIVHIQQKSTH